MFTPNQAFQTATNSTARYHSPIALIFLANTQRSLEDFQAAFEVQFDENNKKHQGIKSMLEQFYNEFPLDFQSTYDEKGVMEFVEYAFNRTQTVLHEILKTPLPFLGQVFDHLFKHSMETAFLVDTLLTFVESPLATGNVGANIEDNPKHQKAQMTEYGPAGSTYLTKVAQELSLAYDLLEVVELTYEEPPEDAPEDAICYDSSVKIDAYKQYCEKHGIETMGPEDFFKQLFEE